MSAAGGWYLIGPLVAVALVGGLCWAFRPLWADQDDERYGPGPAEWAADWPADDWDPPEAAGLAIFTERVDYGLLAPAAIADGTDTADELRLVLGAAGIRATQAVGADGRVAVLVFPEHLAEARRLVGDTPAR